jgi:hypothetical protein
MRRSSAGTHAVCNEVDVIFEQKLAAAGQGKERGQNIGTTTQLETLSHSSTLNSNLAAADRGTGETSNEDIAYTAKVN